MYSLRRRVGMRGWDVGRSDEPCTIEFMGELEHRPDPRTIVLAVQPGPQPGRWVAGPGTVIRLRAEARAGAGDFTFFVPQPVLHLLTASADAARRSESLLSTCRGYAPGPPPDESLVANAASERAAALTLAVAGAECRANELIVDHERAARDVAAQNPKGKSDPFAWPLVDKLKVLLPKAATTKPKLGHCPAWPRLRELVKVRNMLIHHKPEDTHGLFAALLSDVCAAPHEVVLDVFDRVYPGAFSATDRAFLASR
jgi:hypothetical protein